MPQSRRSPTHRVPFQEVVDRLACRPAVDGLLLVGSGAREALTAASDYDLVVVLSEMPVPLHVGITSIEGRFTDLIFYTTEQVDQCLAAAEPLSAATWMGRLVDWLRTGQILFDRNGRLQRGQARVESGQWLRPAGTENGFAPWNRINYNLAVVRRLLRSSEPLHQRTADLRMALYGPADLFFNYFSIRRLHWQGEKAALAYLQQHDPGYLDLLHRFLSEADGIVKFGLYEELARRTVAPVGGLWGEDSTVFILDSEEITPEMEVEAFDFWDTLVGIASVFLLCWWCWPAV